MAITDYIPNIFGQAAPTYIQGLLGAEETKNLQNRANVQGLLGAGLALAQGMSRTGPRRSAAENVLGALAGGFGAAGGAYDQGVKNYVTQQQIAQTQLAQGQAVNKMRSIAEAKAKYPDLAPLFDIDPGEATKQAMNRERAKLYGFGAGNQPTQAATQMPAQAPAQQMQLESAPAVTAKGAPFFGVPNFAVGERYVDENRNVQAQQMQQAPTAQGTRKLVDPAALAQANENRRKAALALSLGDAEAAKFFRDEAERLDPKETFMFRDGRLISSKRGEIANYGGGKILSDAEATQLGLDPNRGKWTIKDNIPSLVAGTEGKTRLLTPEEIANKTLDPNKAYQVTPKGDISVVTDVGSVANKADLIKVLPTQFTGVYKTLKPSVDALIARAPTMTRDQIIAESEKILANDASIRKELDPKLAAQRIAERKAGKTDITNVIPSAAMPLGKEGSNKVDTQLLELGQSRLRLQSISSNFNPKYLERPFQLRMTAVAELEKLGQKPNPQDAADLAAYSEFAQTAYNELNGYINFITGAAVGSGEEEARIRKGVPDPQKDSPTQFFSKLNAKIKEGRLYEARLGYIKNKGMKITDAGIVDVNQIPTLMRNREAEIKKTAKLFGGKEFDAKDPNHKAIVRSILAQEFGLVD
jgi:hypothetical protein